MNGRDSDFPQCAVDVVEPGGRSKSGFSRCEIGKHLTFNTSGLESYLFAKPDPLVHDALLVAAAVEFCDHLRERSTVVWQRDFCLQLPVYEIDKWRDTSLSRLLTDALDFLTGDRWDIHFRHRKIAPTPARQGQLELPPHRRCVMPFSDGLDSWSVAKLEDAKGKGLMRVRLGTARPPKLRQGLLPPFHHVPYRVKFDGYRPAESSARARGFKFALISGVAAYLADVTDVIVPESGQGIFGSELIVNALVHPDYRTHPRFTEKMEVLIGALFGHSVHYRFPRIWSTKGETVREALAIDPADPTWALTRTCWQNSRHAFRDGDRLPCGICTACLLRRMSVLHAGVTEGSPSPYVWGDLTASMIEAGAHPGFPKDKANGHAFRKHAFAGTQFLAKFATWDVASELPEKLAQSAFFVSEATGIPFDTCKIGLRSLVRQHAIEWRDFLDTLGPTSFIANWAQLA